MDRFSWTDGLLTSSEQLLLVQKGVKLYDGPQKTSYDKGKASITTHRILWTDSNKQKSVLSLPLSYLILVEKEPGGFTKSPKLVIHLSTKDENQQSGPVFHSPFSYIQLSFTDNGQEEFFRRLNDVISEKRWMKADAKNSCIEMKSVRSGISGIEKHLQLKKHDRDTTITLAFEDLNNLMKKAEEMVTLSKSISTKIKEKQGSITENETVQFKSYLMSLGISDPITRNTHGTGSLYYEQLAKETSNFIECSLKESGGAMTLTDVYCRINRARGMELLSPDDLEQACNLLKKLNLPVRLKDYENGVKLLQLHSCDEQEVAEETEKIVCEIKCLSANEFARLIGVSVVLAKQRLLVAESLEKLCRDESPEGLIFYPNLFKSQTMF